jgi:hypothetical protein
MKITKLKNENRPIFITTDKEEFINETLAERHQLILDIVDHCQYEWSDGEIAKLIDKLDNCIDGSYLDHIH